MDPMTQADPLSATVLHLMGRGSDPELLVG